METTNEKKQAYRKKIESQLQEWEAKIDVLRAKAEKSKAEAKVEYLDRIETLRRRQEALAGRARELKSSSDAAWNELKSGIERGMNDLKESIKQASSYF